MKTIILIAAVALAATQVSAQSLKGVGADFNKGYDWSVKAKSTKASPDRIKHTVFWTVVALLVWKFL